MLKTSQLHNFGYITDDIPKDIFDSLKEECSIAEQERRNPTGNVKEMISGLTGNLCPKHYYVEKNRDILNKYVLDFFGKVYQPKFDILSEYKLFTHDVPIRAHTPWINIQEKHELIPNHQHDGLVSYVIWIKIPYDVRKETSVGDHASCFQFTYSSILGNIRTEMIRVDEYYEGKIMMFPARLQHCVYPFTTVDDYRISISGNVSFDTSGVN